MEALDNHLTQEFLAIARQNICVKSGLGAFFKPSYLRSTGFAAALFGGDFRDRDEIVSKACSGSDVRTLLCATFDDTSNVPGYRITASHDELSRVREHYHQPSYVISDDFETIAIVSDSDYYWGVAADRALVDAISRSYEGIPNFTDEDIESHIDSGDGHDLKIGRMLRDFRSMCLT